MVYQVEANNSHFSRDFICISDTFLDSSVLEKYKSFQLHVYNLMRANHPSNTKQGGIFIY